MEKVLISGLGLIGSSIARIIKQADEEVEIIGADPDDDTAQFLLSQKVIDQRTTFEQAAPQADFIILAAPVSVIINQLASLARLPLKADVLITDVGSTKVAVMAAAAPLMKRHLNFVGGHPMAGSHETGGRAGNGHLFDGAVYFLVGKTETNRKLNVFQALLKSANCRWQAISATQHDQLVSDISHLPHVIAATLVNTVADSLAAQPFGLEAAAGGFKDTTRIAASDPTMWTAIMLSNADQISQEISQFQTHLKKFQTALKQRDQVALNTFFQNAQRTRKSLDARRKPK